MKKKASQAKNTVSNAASSVASKAKAAVKKATNVVKTVGGKVYSWSAAKLESVKKQVIKIGKDILASIKKMKILEKIKLALDRFFELTKTCSFQNRFRVFFKSGKGAALKLSEAQINAAYKLFTKGFWQKQIGFFKWVYNAGPYHSFLDSSAAGEEAYSAHK